MKKLTISILVLVCVFCCTFGLVACDDGNHANTVNAPTSSVVLTEKTDFHALVSDRVTQSEWEAAFSENSFTNATIKYTWDYYECTFYWKKQTNNADKYVFADGTRQGNQTTFFYTVENGNQYSYMVSDASYVRGDVSFMGDMFDKWCMSFTLVCPNFAEFYTEFNYDETTFSYVYTGAGISTNATFQYSTITYTNISVKIVNGKIAYITCERADYDEGISNFYFYDYGTTTITVPTDYIGTDYNEINNI